MLGSHCSEYEEFYLLGHNAVQHGEGQPTFQNDISFSFSGLESKPSNKPGKIIRERFVC
jgi:hypothetical protein